MEHAPGCQYPQTCSGGCWQFADVSAPPKPWAVGGKPDSSPAVVAIRARIADLQGQRTRYLAYQADRVREGDNHAVWDSAIDINLCDYEIKGLEFALAAIAGSDSPHMK